MPSPTDIQQRTSSSSTTSSTTTLDGSEVPVKSATLPPSSRLYNTSPPPLPAPAIVDPPSEPPAPPQGRFASSAYKLIRETRRKVGRNLNRFGNSFKFKKPADEIDNQESGYVKNVKFRKLVRKNAIKKPNLAQTNSSPKSHPFMTNINRTKSSASDMASNFLTKKPNMKESGIFKNFFKDTNVNMNKLDQTDNKENLDISQNPVKFDEFFKCIESENINRGVVKSSSFSSRHIMSSEILPQKSHSFRFLTENGNYGNVDRSFEPLEEFRLKLESYEGNQSNVNFLNVSGRMSNIPVKCNLLSPPPAELLVNRQESIESWRHFLQQLDDILLNKDGEFV